MTGWTKCRLELQLSVRYGLYVVRGARRAHKSVLIQSSVCCTVARVREETLVAHPIARGLGNLAAALGSQPAKVAPNITVMVATFETALCRSHNKRTDSRLTVVAHHSPRTPLVHPNMPFVSSQTAWYRADWGTGGNQFPSQMRPNDSGRPWTSHSLHEPPPRPAHLFAPLGESPRSFRDSLDRSLGAGGWSARYDAGKWATDLLPKRPGKIAESLGGDKGSRKYSAQEREGPFWNTYLHARPNLKPVTNGKPTLTALNGTSPYVAVVHQT